MFFLSELGSAFLSFFKKKGHGSLFVFHVHLFFSVSLSHQEVLERVLKQDDRRVTKV